MLTKKSIPNALTSLRLVMVVIVVVLMDTAVVTRLGEPSLRWALGVFLLASATDFLDGFLARRWGVVSNFGKLFDPLADKVLVCAAFVMLSGLGLMPAWVVALLLTREFLVTGLRGLAASTGLVLPADQAGKIKTVLHMGTIAAMLWWAQMDEKIELFRLSGPDWIWWLTWIGCLGSSWYSALQYLWASRRLLGGTLNNSN